MRSISSSVSRLQFVKRNQYIRHRHRLWQQCRTPSRIRDTSPSASSSSWCARADAPSAFVRTPSRRFRPKCICTDVSNRASCAGVLVRSKPGSVTGTFCTTPACARRSRQPSCFTIVVFGSGSRPSCRQALLLSGPPFYQSSVSRNSASWA